MRDLIKIANECVNDLNTIGIYPNEIVEWKVNTRAKSRFGKCSYNRKYDEYTIEINVYLLDERVSENSLRETIYHELCHAVDGCMNHGAKWQSLAELVSDCYNVDITRCSNITEKYGKEVASEIVQSKKLYQVKCTKCGYVYSKRGMRAPKWYMHPQNYHHTNCGGTLCGMDEQILKVKW